jgi:hypothetical protein
MTRERSSTGQAPIGAEGQDDVLRRLSRLEAWVEVVMVTLASLGLESVLIELDEARGEYDDARTDYVRDSGDGAE